MRGIRTLLFLYRCCQGLTQVLIGYLVFLCKQNESCRREQVSTERVPDDRVHLSNNICFRSATGLHDPSNQFLHRIIRFEDGRRRPESNGNGNRRRVKEDRKNTVLLPEESPLLLPAGAEWPPGPCSSICGRARNSRRAHSCAGRSCGYA